MSWDEIYKKLEEELGHEPDASDVQNRILEMLKMQVENEVCYSPERRW